MNPLQVCDIEAAGGSVSEGLRVGQVPVGSNLFELIEFTLTRRQPENPLLGREEISGDQSGLPPEEPTLFGVNVAKVREVIRLPLLEPALSKRPEVLGVFQLRGAPIPAIHLACALGFSNEPVLPSAQVLVTEFSGRTTGFVVAGARRIRRVSWNEVIPPQKDLFGGVTGMMLDEKKRFIFILDFEKVLADIETGEQPQQPRSFLASGSPSVIETPVTPVTSVRGVTPVVVIADDSSTARKALTDIVSGFQCQIVACGDGEHAWQECLKLSRLGTPFMVISDVEMPRLDGYSLAKRLRSDQRFVATPFLLHSSLSGEVNRERAMASGADAFIGKFNKRDLITAVDACLKALAQRELVAS
jgi:two-component system chemotaxis response regulator CheV